MFSNWFSGEDPGCNQTSPHKQRFDSIASSLLRLRYSIVVRQHLHERLRFSLNLAANEGTRLPGANAEIVRQYVAECVAGCTASRSRVLRASVRIFLKARMDSLLSFSCRALASLTKHAGLSPRSPDEPSPRTDPLLDPGR